MIACTAHDACSFRVAAQHPDMIVVHDQLAATDVLAYGTSDPTTNPAEVWMTFLGAARGNLLRWEFFHYPLSQHWTEIDITQIFGPHPYPDSYVEDPMKAIEVMRLDTRVMRGLVHMRMGCMLDEHVRGMTFAEIVEQIKQRRAAHSFNLLNLPTGQRVFCGKKDTRYKREWSAATLGSVIDRAEEKLGGAVLYWAFGYYCASQNRVGMMPHNTRGDVWGAFAAGAACAGRPARVWPIGGLDLMTSVQWEHFYRDNRWRKAPPEVIAVLQQASFKDELVTRLVEQRRYCAVSYRAPEHFAFASFA